MEVRDAGLVAGSASPIGITNIKRVADPSITKGCNFVVGANRPDTHVRNANYPRDFQVDLLTDIVLAQPGHRCAQCNQTLESTRGVEVGHIFKLGTFLQRDPGGVVSGPGGPAAADYDGLLRHRRGPAVGRRHRAEHDEKGIIFPPAIAPYQVHLVGLNLTDEAVAAAADALYQELWDQGIEPSTTTGPTRPPGLS